MFCTPDGGLTAFESVILCCLYIISTPVHWLRTMCHSSLYRPLFNTTNTWPWN